jgi:hypothetical protein
MNYRPPSSALDLSRWRNVPLALLLGGGAISLLGFFACGQEFPYAWLLAFMFFLSLCLGALFLVLVHHLFDAGWSVPIRRLCEHLASVLFPWMALLFLPLALLAKKLYAWMSVDPHLDRALAAKQPLFTAPAFYLVSGACFLVWWALTHRLRYWSLRQDETGGAQPTYRLRVYSAVGIFLFALTLTLAAILWMKALQYQWFSTMYGVYYFAGSVWMTLATVYLITLALDRQGTLTEVLGAQQYYFLGSLLLAFTVFYAYIHFSQYFIIWNGNLPEETWWYVAREKGTWWWIGLIIIFGHFLVPFLALLRIDVKSKFSLMVPLCVWAWIMHWFDLAFNILPVAHPTGFPVRWLWLQAGCGAFMGGLLALVFTKMFARHAPFPIKDPRLVEAMGLHHPGPLPPGVQPPAPPSRAQSAAAATGAQAASPPFFADAEAPPQFRGGLR